MASWLRKTRPPSVKDRKCLHHKKDLTFICQDCDNVPICAKCICTIHRKHAVAELCDQIPSARKNIKSYVEEVEKRVIPKLKKETESVDSEISNTEREFKDIAKKFYSITDKMVKSCHELENQNYSVLRKYKEGLDFKIESLRYEVQKRNKLSQSGTPLQLYDISRCPLDETDSYIQSHLPGTGLKPYFIVDKLEDILKQLSALKTIQEEIEPPQVGATAPVMTVKSVDVKILLDYEAENTEQHTGDVKDTTKNVIMVENGWCERKLPLNIDTIPCEFVKVNGKGKNFSVRRKRKERAIVRFSYEPIFADELPLKKNEIVTILEKPLDDQGWWRGELNGRIGMFPNNFVEILF